MRIKSTALTMTLVAVLFISVLTCLSMIGSTAVFSIPAVAVVYPWEQVNQGGFGIPNPTNNILVHDMTLYNDRLYAGTMNEIVGCQVWEYSGGTSWAQVSEYGFGVPISGHNRAVDGMVVHEGLLYASTWNWYEGCQVYVYDGGTAWTQVNEDGFDAAVPPNNGGAHDMVVYEGSIYAGTRNWNQGCQVWRYDGGTTWNQVNNNGFGIAAPTNNKEIWSMAVCAGEMYAGTWNTVSGCQVWRYDGGTDWSLVSEYGFGIDTSTNNDAVHNLAVCGGILYAESPNIGGGCQVWRYDGGTAWTQVNQNGFGIENPANNEDIWAMDSFEGRLYAGTGNFADGCQVWRYDGGTTWTQVNENGFGTSPPIDNPYLHCLIGYQGKLYAGTYNNVGGCQVWAAKPPSAYYFAEGYTGAGFQEYICLGNPGDEPAAATITYLFPDGTTQDQPVEVPANSRTTVNVNAAVGPDREVSAQVTSAQSIVAERPIYFLYGGVWSGGHDAVGATATSNAWYFAEGYTGIGFEEWICVLNPGNAAADLTFRFMTQEEGLKEVTGFSVGAHSRASFKANQILGDNYQTSLELTSTSPIVAERPMYYIYQGTNAWNWTGGHCVMGTPFLSRSYYFAEGTTRSNFEEWLTLQNPNPDPITIQAFYQLGPGQGDPVQAAYEVPGNYRRTIYVPSEVGTEKDVSVLLTCTVDFLAERPMYFDYSYIGLRAQGGHCVIGSPSPAGNWFLAEGYTGEGFNQWICLQNPGDTDSTAEITYYTQEAGALPPVTVPVPARTRNTIMVNDSAGVNYQLSTGIRVTAGPNIVVERPMYFDFSIYEGGHDVVGYSQ